jgi:hypothetical protein
MTSKNPEEKNKEDLKKELMKLVQEGKRLEELYNQIMEEGGRQGRRRRKRESHLL